MRRTAGLLFVLCIMHFGTQVADGFQAAELNPNETSTKDIHSTLDGKIDPTPKERERGGDFDTRLDTALDSANTGREIKYASSDSLEEHPFQVTQKVPEPATYVLLLLGVLILLQHRSRRS